MPHLAVAHVQPDLVLTVVLCWALVRGITEGAVCGFLGGFALDMASGAPFGLHTFVLTVVGSLAGFGVTLIPRERMLLVPAVVVVCTILQQGLQVWLLRAAGWPLSWGQVLVTVAIPAALVNLLLVILIYPLAGLLGQHAAREDLGW